MEGETTLFYSLHDSPTSVKKLLATLDYQTIGDRPIFLGVGDMVMGNNLIEHARYIAKRVEGGIK